MIQKKYPTEMDQGWELSVGKEGGGTWGSEGVPPPFILKDGLRATCYCGLVEFGHNIRRREKIVEVTGRTVFSLPPLIWRHW